MIILPHEEMSGLTIDRLVVGYGLYLRTGEVLTGILRAHGDRYGGIQTLVSRLIGSDHLFRGYTPSTTGSGIVGPGNAHQEIIVAALRDHTPRNGVVLISASILHELNLKDGLLRVLVGWIKHVRIIIQELIAHFRNI